MKVLGKITLTLGLMIIVSLFLTSCSGGGLVTPELQLESEEDIYKLEETEEMVEETEEVAEQATETEGQAIEELIEEAVEEIETEEIVVETGSFYLNVPYEKYAGANWCLPASSAMTFKYFGFNISQAEIANVVIEDGSSSVFRMIKYARNLGFEANYKYMTIEEIKNSLKKDIPVIAVQNYSLTSPYSHARVIIGFNDQNQEIISNDPTVGKDYKIDYSVFRALSLASDPNLCKVIVISPKGKGIDTENIIAESNTNNS